jgi:hypothetical protein
MPGQVDSRDGSVGGTEDTRRGSEQSEGPEGSVSESWASEFRGRRGDEESSHAETDDGVGLPQTLRRMVGTELML